MWGLKVDRNSWGMTTVWSIFIERKETQLGHGFLHEWTEQSSNVTMHETWNCLWQVHPVMVLLTFLVIYPQTEVKESTYEVGFHGYHWQDESKRRKLNMGSELCWMPDILHISKSQVLPEIKISICAQKNLISSHNPDTMSVSLITWHP